ncbi:MAG: SMP-30/gluconolactonase/LRE family protein [bacterium]|nr:SMP-30/gluconolactonase/LRE family protein [bacterium]
MKISKIVASGVLLSAGIGLWACTSANPSGTNASPAPSSSPAPTASPSATNASPAPSSSPAPTAKPLAPPSLLKAFDPNSYEFAEGLALDKAGEFAYTGAATGLIFKVSLADGSKSTYGQIPGVPSDQSVYVLGTAFDSTGNLFIACASMGSFQKGIYKIPAGGGNATLFASDAAMGFPNGLAVDASDALYVSDSSGKIWHVTKAGVVTKWFEDAAVLTPDASSSCATGFFIGANGIALGADALYITNSDRASLVKIPLKGDGTAGTAEAVVASNCSTFRGADGLAIGPDGSFYVASNQQEAVLKVTSGGEVSTVASGSLFAFPASLSYNDKDGVLYVINAAFGDKKEPGIVKVPIVAK